MTSPFAPSTSLPGHGTIDLAVLPPCTPVLHTLSYQYPLKLIAPSPITLAQSSSGNEEISDGQRTIYTVFLLSYGGGLVAGDSINLSVTLAPSTRLILLTQGSTKVFKTPSPHVVTRQRMVVDVHGNAGLVYLPDPVQPFEKSAFEQSQIYNLYGKSASLCVCDWVSQGRTARGERWGFWKYGSRNEVWGVRDRGEDNKKLLLRDNVILDAEANGEELGPDYVTRMDGLGVFGTLILCGPLFEALGKFFLEEFRALPRIGARQWDANEDEGQEEEKEMRRTHRQKQEKEGGVLWTASSVRGFVLVKFGAREVEGIKKWLSAMLKEEGSLPNRFGERALLCLR
ncbi:urease accessory protein UreD [Rhizodiscina lignyota]|uniref:Urease accessory protein UreD n=1 Tax=Rhizodiscina lignyota TaxID=1504668 RepID=A0A9P4MAF4_9PEZI|nr:urease accessory protein UreD [Rhizodiscina lignyota]